MHPTNPDVVYVAAVGPVFADGPERGVFRSRDGGSTWEKVLFINERTGVFSLVFDPSIPDRLYAAAWRAQRKRLDPRVAADGVTQADLEAQQQLLSSVREAASRALALSATLAKLATGGDAVKAKEASALRMRLTTASGPYPQPMLIDQLSNIWRMANQADQRPGRDAFVRLEDLRMELAGLEKQGAALR